MKVTTTTKKKLFRSNKVIIKRKPELDVLTCNKKEEEDYCINLGLCRLKRIEMLTVEERL